MNIYLVNLFFKFAVTHTTKTTVAQVTSTIKENLGLPQEHRVYLYRGEL